MRIPKTTQSKGFHGFVKRGVSALFLYCALSIISISLSGCGQKTYDSPSAVFEAAQVASAKRDMEGVMNCLTEESQQTFVEMLVGFFGMMKGFAGLADKALPEPIAKLDKVMKKHGISDKVLEGMEDESYAVKDKAGLVGDFFKAMNVPKEEELPPLWSSLLQPSGKLEDISIDGDTAVATAVYDDARLMIRFVKIGESWRINESSPAEFAYPLPGELAYPSNWPDLSNRTDLWKTDPLSTEETNQLGSILESATRMDSFDEMQKLLIARIPSLMADELGREDEFDYLSPLLLDGKPFTGFTKNGPTFTRFEAGKITFRAVFNPVTQEGKKLNHSWDHYKSEHPKRGSMMQWNEEGILVRQTLYIDGKQYGLSFMSYPNGQRRSEGLYVEGKRQGPHTTWHQNGQKRYVYMYEHGVRNGPYTNWHENGQLYSQSAYKDGKRHGEYKRWHSNGQQWAIRMHENGETVSEKYWNSEGEEQANDSRR